MDGFDSELVRGNLEMMVLSTLADGPKYGYLIQSRLKDSSRSRISIQAGTLYPILHRLETAKLVKARWDETTGRRRKWYDLTAAGRKQLTQQVREWQSFVDCIKNVLGNVLEPSLSTT
jgi:PadR family transcriptional regulator, regulatory protein PadR